MDEQKVSDRRKICYIKALSSNLGGIKMQASTRDFQEFFANSPSEFLNELHSELVYYQRTKVITMFDIYRIRKRVLPMYDILISTQSKTYEAILNTHEHIILQAVREEPNLSDVTQMANENKYMLRNCFKIFLNSVPGDSSI